MILKNIIKKMSNENVKDEILNCLEERTKMKIQRSSTVNLIDLAEAIRLINSYEQIIKLQKIRVITCITKQKEILKKFKN